MSRRRGHQGGVALIALAAILVLGTSWLLVSRMNASTAQLAAAKRARNAAVLSQAKQALIGYVASQASKGLPNLSPEQNPGALPCPEASGYFDSTSQQGQAASSCSLPIVGRFPWRTIGTDKLVDAEGEPLWYVVGSGWAYTSRTNYPVINSNTKGQLTVDGVANAAVALIIAPGAAVTAATATGCTAWTQTRSPTGTPDLRNYLECENATSPADSTWVTKGTSGSNFNDQVLAVTVADIMPGIEAAVAKRIENEIVPQLKSMYASSSWGTNVSSANPVYPFAASFANPESATYRGAGVTGGLLPMTYTTDYTWNGSAYVSSACNTATNTRCTPSTFITWTTPSVTKVSGSGSFGSPACTTDATYAWCWGTYTGNPVIKYEDLILNVANAMRQRTGTPMSYAETWAYNNGTGSWTMLSSGAPTVSYTLKSDGSFGTSFQATFPSYGSGGWYYFYGTRSLPFSDHPLLDTRYTADTSWFVRNEWHKLVYYAVASGFTPSGLPTQPSCSGAACITTTDIDTGTATAGRRAILILAGRNVNGADRTTSSSLRDWLEFGNSAGSYRSGKTNTVAVSSPLSDTGGANAYVVAASSFGVGGSFFFKATNANTGASTLTTGTTGTLPIVTTSGASLSAGDITAGAVVQVLYNGSRFVLLKRPFNDRIVVVDSN